MKWLDVVQSGLISISEDIVLMAFTQMNPTFGGALIYFWKSLILTWPVANIYIAFAISYNYSGACTNNYLAQCLSGYKFTLPVQAEVE